MGAKLLQLTNPSIGAVAVDSNLPFGVTTLSYPTACSNCGETYSVVYSGSDTVKINRSGAYRIIYNSSLVASEAGNLVLELMVNGSTKYTITSIATAGGTINTTLPFEVYLPCNCSSNPANIPAYIQIKNTGVAVTSGTSNLIIIRE